MQTGKGWAKTQHHRPRGQPASLSLGPRRVWMQRCFPKPKRNGLRTGTRVPRTFPRATEPPPPHTRGAGGAEKQEGLPRGPRGNICLAEEAKRPLEQKREERDTRGDAAAPRGRAETDAVPWPASPCPLPPTNASFRRSAATGFACKSGPVWTSLKVRRLEAERKHSSSS